jgi:hypothetical protein
MNRPLPPWPDPYDPEESYWSEHPRITGEPLAGYRWVGGKIVRPDERDATLRNLLHDRRSHSWYRGLYAHALRFLHRALAGGVGLY